MNLEEMFARQIIEKPDDYTTRLVFSDWLEDNGFVERAELVRDRVKQSLREFHSEAYVCRFCQGHGKVKERRNLYVIKGSGPYLAPVLGIYTCEGCNGTGKRNLPVHSEKWLLGIPKTAEEITQHIERVEVERQANRTFQQIIQERDEQARRDRELEQLAWVSYTGANQNEHSY